MNTVKTSSFLATCALFLTAAATTQAGDLTANFIKISKSGTYDNSTLQFYSPLVLSEITTFTDGNLSHMMFDQRTNRYTMFNWRAWTPSYNFSTLMTLSGGGVYSNAPTLSLFKLDSGTSNPQTIPTQTENVRLNAYGSSWLNGGWVGIGTQTPGAKLELYNNDGWGAELRFSQPVTSRPSVRYKVFPEYIDNSQQYLISEASTTNYQANFIWRVPPTNSYISMGWLMRLTGGGSNSLDATLELFKATAFANSSVKFAANGDSYVAGGKLGVGTTTPSTTLEVNGVAKITDVLRLPPRSTPGSASEGDVYYDSSAHTLKVYNGTTWKSVTLQ